MKRIALLIAVLVVGLIAVWATPGYSQGWVSQSSGTTRNLYGVRFVSPDTGWAVGGYGVILRTYNGGTNWDLLSSGTSNDFYDVMFINSRLGWVVGYHGMILLTTDGGSTWNPATESGTDEDLWCCNFSDSLNGWAVGKNGTIVHTTNGGDIWSSQNSGVSNHLKWVFPYNSDTVWACGKDGTILKTTNGGAAWAKQWEGQTSHCLNRVVFPENPLEGWIGGRFGYVIHTTDGGGTWVQQRYDYPNCLMAGVYFTDNQYGWGVGKYGVITSTINGGQDWIDEYSGTSNWLRALHAVERADTFHLWAVGTGGTILHKVSPYTQGAIDGYVYEATGKGPIEGAVVKVEESYWLDTTDANGYFLIDPVFVGTSYCVSVSAPPYFPDTTCGVVVSEGDTTTVGDFHLDWSYIGADPDSFTVSVAIGDTLYDTLMISNLGTGPLDYSISIRETSTKQADVLLVDDDHSFHGPTWTDARPYFTDALDANGYTYDIFEITTSGADGPDAATMADYPVVIWFTGEGWQLQQTLTPNDEANLATYLDGGGNLFLSAMDYFYDRHSSAGNFSPGQFPYDYLGVTWTYQDRWLLTNPETGTATGMPGSVAEGMTFSLYDVYTTTKDGLCIDEITHVGTDVFQITSPSPTGIAACQYEGANGFKMVFTTVDFAGLADGTSPSTRTELMASIMDFFVGGGPTWLSVDPSTGTVPPGDSMEVEVTFAPDTSMVENTTYTCEIHIHNNSLNNSDVIVPVEMKVPAILYEEYFTDGNLHLNWFAGWEGSELTAVSFPGNPSGDGWIGKLSSPLKPLRATSLAGRRNLKDYSVEAYLYTQVSDTVGPHHGVVARWDTTTGSYYLLMCDFDDSARIELSYNEEDTRFVIHLWTPDSIPEVIPDTTGWHKLKLKAVGDSIWAYFDDEELPGCPFIDSRADSGFFGVYAFASSWIDSTLCDDIIVRSEGEVVGFDEEPMAGQLPKTFNLAQNYPNPFNPVTHIAYTLPKGCWVKLEVYNILGQRVTTLVDQPQKARCHQVRWKAKVASGVYFYRIQAGEYMATKKMVLLR